MARLRPPFRLPGILRLSGGVAPWIAALLLSGCAAQLPPLDSPGPDWGGMPASWAKLEEIERWLSANSGTAPIDQVLAAELELAEGRLTFAEDDRARSASAPVSSRLDAARSGFEVVLTDPRAGDELLLRAQAGLARAQQLADGEARFAAGGPPGVISRTRWGAAPGVPRRMTRTPQNWSRITVHHTANSSGSLRGASVHTVASVLRTIQNQHLNERAWGDIGYHYLIDPDGRVYEGRRLEYQGAHAGDHSKNQGNVGVCLLGHFEVEHPSPKALGALAILLDDLRSRYRIPASQVFGHSHFTTTACPGQHLAPWIAHYSSGRAMSSMSSSSERFGLQPSATNFAGSPTSTSGSPGRAVPAAGRVR